MTKTYLDGFELGSGKQTYWKDADGNVHHTEFGNITGPIGAAMWWREGMPSPYCGDHKLGRPEYKHLQLGINISDEQRTHGGTRAGMMFTNWRPHEAGWRWVEPVGAGELVRASIYAHAWYSECSDKPHEPPVDKDCRTSIHWAHMYLSMGIDPTGGLDPWADTVVWGERVEQYGTYDGPVRSPSVTAEADEVTIFFRSEATHPLKHCDCYVDDLEVVVEPVGAAVEFVPPAYDYRQRYTVLPQMHDEWKAIRWRRAVAVAGAKTLGSMSHSIDDAGSGPEHRILDMVNPTQDEYEYVMSNYPGAVVNVITAESEVEAACKLFDGLCKEEDIALSQNDPRWKELDLGEAPGGETIGEAGCFLVFATIALRNVLGTDVTPDKLNLLLAAHGGPFVYDDLLMWEMFVDLFSCFDNVIRNNEQYTEGDLGELLYNGWEVGLRNADGTHFVYLEAVHDGLYIIDPWDGSRLRWDISAVSGIRAAHVASEEAPQPPAPTPSPGMVERKPLMAPHLQTMVPNVIEEYIAPMAQRGTPLAWVKVFQAGDAKTIKQVSPQTRVLYRKYCHDQGQFLNEIHPGEWEMDVPGYVEWLRPELIDYGEWIDAVESINEEVPTGNMPKLKAISTFDAAFCRQLYDANLGVVAAVATAGVGNPDYGVETQTMCSILGPAIMDTHAICAPHAYTPARPEKNWLCTEAFDMRPAYSWNDMFMELGYLGIPFIIGEDGPIAALGDPHPLSFLDGWRSSKCINGNEEELVRMAFALQDECWAYNDFVGYEAIQARLMFTSGIGVGWDKFLLWGEQWRRFREAYEALDC